MEIRDKNVLVLGGWGLVGTAVCHELLERAPNSITIASLRKEEAEEACIALREIAGITKLRPVWGNIFVRSHLKELSRSEILNSPEHRLTIAQDVLERTTAIDLENFTLFKMIDEAKPDIIVDCVNTATGVAYQDVYSAGLKVMQGVKDAREGDLPGDLLTEVEKLLSTLYLPQLVRHIQVLYHAMKLVGTKSYVKVGTSGTGGMGLNIPYTHSEDKPSRVLLSKSCIAGAHSLLLFLIARTPDAPYVKEVKPATAIAWKNIDYGEIKRGGKPIPLYDCPIDKAVDLNGEFSTGMSDDCKPTGENLKGVFIDTGENGTFSIGEFTAITTTEQMEYITPEEIARMVVWEVEGGATGHDVVAALDAAILGPTYRAGVMRSLAIEKMKTLAAEHSDSSIAYELLGPPRLSKLLYEAHLLKRTCSSLKNVLDKSPEDLSDKLTGLISQDAGVRSRILSIGIPILLPDGRRLLRAPLIKVPNDPRKQTFEVSAANIDNWCHNGWIDMRVSNLKLWQERIGKILSETKTLDSNDSSSRNQRDRTFWHAAEELDEGEVVGWIFIHEDEGRRIK